MMPCDLSSAGVLCGFLAFMIGTNLCNAESVLRFRVRKESACRASEESGMGFCLPTDRLSSQCVGRMAVAQQSVDCGSDEWCCQRSGRRFKSLLKKAGGQRSVDDAPCGHGNTINRLLFGSAASGNIRRFARIFNGNPVDEADVCWVAAVFDKGNTTLGLPLTFLCAGAILNSTHIITAAHCVDRLLSQTSQLLIQTGLTDASPGIRSSGYDCAQQFNVQRLSIPNGYDPDNLDMDFAVIKVWGLIMANECTCRACLMDRPIATPSAVTCWSTGFGATREGGMSSLALTKTMIDFVRRDRCEVMLGSMLTGSHRFKLPNSSICAGDAQRGGLCTSDGGAPLTCIIDGRHTLVALGSWAVDCSKMPSVFASLMSCPNLLSDINIPCDLEKASIKAAIALTDLQTDGGPTCGIPGTNEIDPFGISNQRPDKQSQDSGRVKNEAKGLRARIKFTSGFPMMSDNSIPELLVDDDIRPKQGPIIVTNLTVSKLFPSATIVGGTSVPQNQICWQVLVSTGCGGSIISDQFILTAAHCVTISGTRTPKDPRSIRVVLGATQSPVQFPLNNCQELRAVRRIIVHEDYFLGNDTSEWVSGDIALLELDRPLDFRNPCVCRTCLQNTEPQPGEICTVSGFGCQTPTPPSSTCADRKVRDLMKLNVIMPGDSVCSMFFADLPGDSVTCSASNLTHSPCFGDSGGPVVCYNNEENSYYQAGITSFAIFPEGVEKCGLGRWNFQYYTKVKAYIDWIRDEVPDVMVTDPSSFTFHASFNVNLGKGLTSVMASHQLLPNV